MEITHWDLFADMTLPAVPQRERPQEVPTASKGRHAEGGLQAIDEKDVETRMGDREIPELNVHTRYHEVEPKWPL